MKDDTIQPTRISKEEYELFRQWVQDVHGTTRGHLSTEIENALREYRQPDSGTDKLARIEDDVATIKAQLSEAESDGGTSVDAESAPAPDNTTNRGDNTTKPNSNAPRQEKVDYIITKYYDRQGGEVTIPALKAIIRREYAFEDSVLEEYVALITTTLNAKKHPEVQNKWVWGDMVDRVKEEL